MPCKDAELCQTALKSRSVGHPCKPVYKGSWSDASKGQPFRSQGSAGRVPGREARYEEPAIWGMREPLKNESKLTIGEDADKPGVSLPCTNGHLLTATVNSCDLEAANSGCTQSSEELKYESVFLSCL